MASWSGVFRIFGRHLAAAFVLNKGQSHGGQTKARVDVVSATHQGLAGPRRCLSALLGIFTLDNILLHLILSLVLVGDRGCVLTWAAPFTLHARLHCQFLPSLKYITKTIAT